MDGMIVNGQLLLMNALFVINFKSLEVIVYLDKMLKLQLLSLIFQHMSTSTSPSTVISLIVGMMKVSLSI